MASREFLFSKLKLIAPIIAADTITVTQRDPHTIAVKLKNRNTLIFKYNTNGEWSLSTDDK